MTKRCAIERTERAGSERCGANYPRLTGSGPGATIEAPAGASTRSEVLTVNASSNPPDDHDNTRWIDTGSGPGWSPEDPPAPTHQPWCTQHDDGSDDPLSEDDVDTCTNIVNPVPGLLLSMSQERGQTEPAIELERVGAGPGTMTLAQAGLVIDALADLINRGSIGGAR